MNHNQKVKAAWDKVDRAQDWIQTTFLWSLGIIIGLVGCYGWIMNILSIAAADQITGLVILRVIGIFFFPLGVILGLLT